MLSQIFATKKKLFLENIRQIYCPHKSQEEFFHKYKQNFYSNKKEHDTKLLDVHPFIVPITENKDGKLDINWALINKVIKYVKDKILEIIHVQRRGNVIS